MLTFPQQQQPVGAHPDEGIQAAHENNVVNQVSRTIQHGTDLVTIIEIQHLHVQKHSAFSKLIQLLIAQEQIKSKQDGIKVNGVDHIWNQAIQGFANLDGSSVIIIEELDSLFDTALQYGWSILLNIGEPDENVEAIATRIIGRNPMAWANAVSWELFPGFTQQVLQPKNVELLAKIITILIENNVIKPRRTNIRVTLQNGKIWTYSYFGKDIFTATDGPQSTLTNKRIEQMAAEILGYDGLQTIGSFNSGNTMTLDPRNLFDTE